MKLSIREIAEYIQADFEGDPSLVVDSISKIEEGKKGSITFLANPKYQAYIYTTSASAVIVSHDFVPQKAIRPILLKVSDPYQAFSSLLEKLGKEIHKTEQGIHPQAFLSEDIQFGENIYIGPFAYIGKGVKIEDNVSIFPFTYIGDHCKIGKHTKIYPHVTIYHSCEIGNNCILHAGVRIGSDGFGFAPQKEGSYKKLIHIGKVIIKDNVEIGANTTIDRATIGETIIDTGVKLDNLIQIAHNVNIGSHTVIAAQTGISGSTKLGKMCMVGGQAGFAGHLKIADGTKVEGKSGVTKSILKPNQGFRGSPARERKVQIAAEILSRKLEELYQRVTYLEEKIQAFESQDK